MNAHLHCHDCPQPARHRLHELNKCTDHYIEALEHCAHITSLTKIERDAPLDELDRLRVERLAERIAQRSKEKKARERLTGRPEGNQPLNSAL